MKTLEWVETSDWFWQVRTTCPIPPASVVSDYRGMSIPSHTEIYKVSSDNWKGDFYNIISHASVQTCKSHSQWTVAEVSSWRSLTNILITRLTWQNTFASSNLLPTKSLCEWNWLTMRIKMWINLRICQAMWNGWTSLCQPLLLLLSFFYKVWGHPILHLNCPQNL